jgi:hypothetical protein
MSGANIDTDKGMITLPEPNPTPAGRSYRASGTYLNF